MNAELFGSLHRQVEELLASAEAGNHEHTYLQLGITNEQRFEFVRLGQTLVRDENDQEDPLDRVGIPKTIHRLWLTDINTPSFPPDEYIKRISKQINLLSEYRFVFWTNSGDVAEEIKKRIGAPSVQCADIRKLSAHPLFERIQAAIASRKFVLAGDICKYLLLGTYGGIYADLGVQFGPELLNLVHRSDLSLSLCSALFYQPAFMAAPANAPVFRVWLRLLQQPEILTSLCMKGGNDFTPGWEIWMHGGVGFTAAMMLFFDGSYGFLSIPSNRGLLHHESLSSWYKPGNSLGGLLLRDALISHLDRSLHLRFLEENQKLDDCLATSSALSRGSLIRLKIETKLQKEYWCK